MKKSALIALLILLSCLAASAEPRGERESAGRLVSGKVTDRQENPLVNAVVYLTNTRTRATKTYIVGQDGVYRFPALSPNVDYEVYAQHNGRKSDTKTVSQFDNRQNVNINLRIDLK
jgi:hypothetical protein